MENEAAKFKEISGLFERIQQAKDQAEKIKAEMLSIKAELEKSETSVIFQSLREKCQREAAEPKPSSSQATDGTPESIKAKDQEETQEASTSNELNDTKETIQSVDDLEFPVTERMQEKIVEISDSDEDVFVPKKVKYDFEVVDGYVNVFTDGACENNGAADAKAGIGVWFGDKHPLNLSKPVKGKATNNVAEIQACIEAVKIAKANGIEKLQINTDSQFVVNAMTKWIFTWKNNGWKLSNGKGEVKNKEEFQKLDALCSNMMVRWVHVSGHAGIFGNEKADELARDGAKFYFINKL